MRETRRGGVQMTCGGVKAAVARALARCVAADGGLWCGSGEYVERGAVVCLGGGCLYAAAERIAAGGRVTLRYWLWRGGAPVLQCRLDYYFPALFRFRCDGECLRDAALEGLRRLGLWP